MKKIYLVVGTTGEYSDRCEWPVKAYYNEIDANTHVKNALAKAGELMLKYGRYNLVPHGSNEFDSNMQIDYTGVDYCVWPIDSE